MSLARSTKQPIWLLSRYIRSTDAGASRPRCSRCSIRHYSDQQQPEVASLEGEEPSTSTSTGIEQNKQPPKNLNLLFRDDVESMPGLSALDELNPNAKRINGRSTSSTNQDSTYDVWNKTLERVMSSFTQRQLWQMGVDAKVPHKMFRAYNVKKGHRPTKKPLVKALISHHFGIKDPHLEAETLAAKAKTKRTTETLEVPITQIALLLLVLRGQSEMQRLGQVHRVKVRPFRKQGDDSVALLLQGSEQSIEIVRQWVITFCESIRSITSPISSFAVSSAPVQPPSDHRLRMISQRSQTIVSVDENRENITIYSVEDKSLNAAQSMIVQSIHDVHLARRRHFYSFASPPIPSDTLLSVPAYGFVPYVGPTPLPWLADPGPSASLFRIARQDIVGAAEKAFSNVMQDDPDMPNLRSLQTAETYDSTRASSTKDDAFAHLQEQLHIPEDSPGSFSYTAEFGHLLFDNQKQAGSSRVLSLIAPPLPGIWPLEHSLEWLRKGLEGEEAIHSKPSFCPVIPPLAANMDSGLVPSSTSYNLTAEADLSPAEKLQRRLDYWAEQLQQLGVPLRSNSRHQLADIVDVDASSYSEDLLITFAGDRADLAIQLRVKTEGEQEEAGLTLHKAQWVQKANADVLVPESGIDMRLGVAHNEHLSEETILADEGLQRYLEELKAIPVTASVEDSELEEQSAVPPQTAIVQGRKVFMVGARRVCRWEWQLFEDEAVQFKGKLVMEKAIQDDLEDNVSTFKIVFDEIPNAQLEMDERRQESVFEEAKSSEGEVGTAEATISEEETSDASSQSSPKERSVWRVMRPLVGFFLAQGYRSLPR